MYYKKHKFYLFIFGLKCFNIKLIRSLLFLDFINNLNKISSVRNQRFYRIEV